MKTRKMYSFDEKMKIIEHAELHSARDAAKKYDISYSTLASWRARSTKNSDFNTHAIVDLERVRLQAVRQKIVNEIDNLTKELDDAS